MPWLHVPETDCPSALAAEAWIWASCLQNPAFTPAHMSNGVNTHGEQSSPHKMPDTSPTPRSGMMSQHLTESPSGVQSTQSLPDIHASHLAKPGNEKEPTTNGTSGRILPELSEKSNQDGYSSKMSPGMSRLVRKPCCEKYEIWVSRLRLASLLRKKQAQRMSGSDGTAWPTPMAGTPAQNGNNAAGNNDFSRRAMVLAEQVALWGTPRASDATKGGPNQSFGAGGVPLPAQAAQWPTPKALTGGVNCNRAARGAGGPDLQEMTENWPTPSAMQDTKGDTAQVAPRIASGKQIALAHRARTFTHPDQAINLHGQTSWRDRLQASRQLWALMKSSHGRSIARRLFRNRHKRRLNPLFVEWLMGWPSGHALLSCSETEFIHWQRQMRGALSAMPLAIAPWIWEPPAQTTTATQSEMF